MLFNLAKSSAKNEKDLFFICTICDRMQRKQSKTCLCGNDLFKVARSMPLIDYPLEPYRNQSDEENGQYLETPGDINTSQGGAEDVDFPQDGAAGEEVGTPNAKSDDLTQTDPMRDVNRPKSDYGVGVHTMNSVMPTSSPNPNVFNRTKSKLNYGYLKGQ